MFEDFKNTIDFFIRNKTKFSRKNFQELNPDLIKRNELENQYTYDVLNQFFEKISIQNANILDIGCKNWFYARGEYDFFNSFLDDFSLDGIELDAYRLYSNFYSRYEVALYYIKNLKNTNYIADNLLNLNKKYDYITWFLPFILIKPLQYWGLPKKYFCPDELLSHAYGLLNDNGQMLIINQGEIEEKVQEELFKKLNIPYEKLGEIRSNFFEYKNSRYGFLVKKS